MAEFKSYTVKLDTVLDAKIIEAIEADSRNHSLYIREQLSLSLGIEPRRSEGQQADSGAVGIATMAALQAMAERMIQMKESIDTLAAVQQTNGLTPELLTEGFEYLADRFTAAVNNIVVNPPPITINMQPASNGNHSASNGDLPVSHQNGNGHHPKAKRPTPRTTIEEPVTVEVDDAESALEQASDNFLSMFG